jgi:hypothetical protein
LPDVAVNIIREKIHETCKAMAPEQWKEVVENLMADLESYYDALKCENPELFR